MEIYMQESVALVFMKRISAESRLAVFEPGKAFPILFERAEQLQRAKVPTFSLDKGDATGRPLEVTGRRMNAVALTSPTACVID